MYLLSQATKNGEQFPTLHPLEQGRPIGQIDATRESEGETQDSIVCWDNVIRQRSPSPKSLSVFSSWRSPVRATNRMPKLPFFSTVKGGPWN